MALKQRDDGATAVLLLLNDTRLNRMALATGRESLRALFPLKPRSMLAALRAGRFPGASGLILL